MTWRGFVHFNANARQFEAKHHEPSEKFVSRLDDVSMPGHQPIETTELTGMTKEWGVEIGERSECPDAIAVALQDIPGLITWLTQQWAAKNQSTNK